MNKKIAIITSACSWGGTEISSLRLCKLLVKNGHKVMYISPGSIYQKEMEGVKFLFYKFSKKNPVSIINAIRTIAKYANKEKIDILHCQDATACILCCYAKKLLHIKSYIIWHERGIHYNSYPIMVKKYSSLIDKIICNSYYERTLLLMNKCDPKKTCVIYNFIEKQVATKPLYAIRRELKISSNEFVVGAVGRQTWDKGFNYLILATAKLLDSIPNLKLLLVGDGENHQELVALARKLNISDRVIFSGFRKDIPNMLSVMDIFVIPSLYEAFGNVTVEAMLAKKPVVGSRVGGITEVIQDGINGWLVPSADVQELVLKIKYVYSHIKEIDGIVQNAYNYACGKYNFHKYYSEICKIYMEK